MEKDESPVSKAADQYNEVIQRIAFEAISNGISLKEKYPVDSPSFAFQNRLYSEIVLAVHRVYDTFFREGAESREREKRLEDLELVTCSDWHPEYNRRYSERHKSFPI